jgi:uncharacterized protein (TIGR02301 family)
MHRRRSDPGMMMHGTTRRVGWLAGVIVGIMLAVGPLASQASAQGEGAQQRQDSRPYDEDLFQLAEVLGAVHYLRALCGADEGQKWRDQMRGLVDAEGASALRRAQLVRSFNKGYRGYGRTYRRCTDLARRSIDRLMAEGRSLAKRILDRAG